MLMPYYSFCWPISASQEKIPPTFEKISTSHEKISAPHKTRKVIRQPFIISWHIFTEHEETKKRRNKLKAEELRVFVPSCSINPKMAIRFFGTNYANYTILSVSRNYKKSC